MSPPKTTGGKGEPNIVLMRKPQGASQHGTQKVNAYNRIKQDCIYGHLNKGKR